MGTVTRTDDAPARFLGDAPVRARDDLMDALAGEWARLGEPGTWWSGADRVALAAAARDAVGCELCQARTAALSPTHVRGEHRPTRHLAADDGAMARTAVDAAHRIATDAARLTEPWYRAALAGGLSVGHYVELVAIVATVAMTDTFAAVLGAAAPPLPRPAGGEPSREIPDGATVHSAWVPTVAPEDATGAVARAYGDRPVVTHIVRALSYVPQELAGHSLLGRRTYKSPDLAIGPSQVELLAATVSQANDCFY